MSLVVASVTTGMILLGAGSPCAAQMSPGMLSKNQTSGSTATGATSPAKPMTEADMAMVRTCNALGEAAMAKHADCMTMMHAHPDMMKHPDAVKSGG